MSDSVRPDEVISPEAGTAVQLRGLVKDVALFLPNLIKLLSRLIQDRAALARNASDTEGTAR